MTGRLATEEGGQREPITEGRAGSLESSEGGIQSCAYFVQDLPEIHLFSPIILHFAL
jgi:hypothetical protein